MEYPRFELKDELTPEQVEHYNRHGFLHFKNFITPQQVEEVVAAMKDVQAQWIRDGVQKVNGVPIKWGKDLDGSTLVQRYAFSNLYSPYLAKFLEDPRFKTLFPLIGTPDVRVGANEKDGLVINHYVHAEGSAYSRLGWHTDGLRDIFLGTKLNPLLNVGVHLSNLGPEHGGLRLIPGTHNQGVWKMLTRKAYFRDHEPDKDEIALIPAAGDLTVHDGRLWHRVAQSTISGEASRRRVMYVPVISGKYQPKNADSPTPLYQKLQGFAK